MKNLLFITFTLVSTFIIAQDCVVNTNQAPFIDDPDGVKVELNYATSD